MSLRVVLSLSTLYFKTVDWSLTKRIKRWERNGVLGCAGVCRGGGGEGGGEEIRAPPKNAFVGGYDTGGSEEKIRVLIAGVETMTFWLLSTTELQENRGS